MKKCPSENRIRPRKLARITRSRSISGIAEAGDAMRGTSIIDGAGCSLKLTYAANILKGLCCWGTATHENFATSSIDKCQQQADVGVGCGPGGPPHFAHFLRIQTLHVTGPVLALSFSSCAMRSRSRASSCPTQRDFAIC